MHIIPMHIMLLLSLLFIFCFIFRITRKDEKSPLIIAKCAVSVVRVFIWLYPMIIISHTFHFYWAYNYVIIFTSTSMISVFLIQCTYRQIFKCYSILIIKMMTASDFFIYICTILDYCFILLNFCFLNLVINIIVKIMDKRDSFIRFLMSHYYVLRFINQCICYNDGKILYNLIDKTSLFPLFVILDCQFYYYCILAII